MFLQSMHNYSFWNMFNNGSDCVKCEDAKHIRRGVLSELLGVFERSILGTFCTLTPRKLPKNPWNVACMLVYIAYSYKVKFLSLDMFLERYI